MGYSFDLEEIQNPHRNMRTRILRTLITTVVLIGGVTAFVPSSPSCRHATNTHAFRQSTQLTKKRAEVVQLEAKASFKTFDDLLAQDGALLVDFYATWCGPCKMMTEALGEIGPQMKGEVKIFKIDSDAHTSLSSRYKVRGLPTLILFKDGMEVNRLEGFLPAPQLMEQIRTWLQGA